MPKNLACGGKPQSSKGGKQSKKNDKDQSASSSSGPKEQLWMYAVVGNSEGGGPEVLHVQRVPRPVPKANEVLVKVCYAAVNGPDVVERKRGMLSPQIKKLEEAGIKSKYLGLECSGTICAYGEGISEKDQQTWKIDTKVRNLGACFINFLGFV